MQTRRLVLFTALLLACSACFGRDHHSRFGFTAHIGDDWFVLSGESVKEDRQLWHAALAELAASVDTQLLEQARSRADSGAVEYLFFPHRHAGDTLPAGNIAVCKRKQTLPHLSQAAMDTLCAAVRVKLPVLLGPGADLYQCEFMRLPAGNAVLLQCAGTTPGTVAVQYQIQCWPDEVLLVTGTTGRADLASMRKALEGYVRSIKCDRSDGRR